MKIYKLIIVEGDLFSRALIKGVLAHKENIEVVELSSEKELLKAKSPHPDFLILDYDTRNTQTSSCQSRLLERIYRRFPTVIISAQKNISSVVDFFRIGAVDYILKGETTGSDVIKCVDDIIACIEEKEALEIFRKRKRKEVFRI